MSRLAELSRLTRAELIERLIAARIADLEANNAVLRQRCLNNMRVALMHIADDGMTAEGAQQFANNARWADEDTRT